MAFGVFKLKKRILIICPYPVDECAGQRFKYEKHLKYLEENGYEITIESFMNDAFWKIVYKKGFILQKIIYTLVGYLNRILTIFKLNKFSKVYVFLWVTPFGGSFFERIYNFFSNNNLIYDVEDNLININDNESRINIRLRSKSKIYYLLKKSKKVICSTPDLEKLFRGIRQDKNVYFIPPSLNLNRYVKKNIIIKDEIVIGWTGTFSSMHYLKTIENILVNISKIRKISLLVISNFNYKNDKIKYTSLNWNKNSEIQDLLKIDIGIYPLINDDWIIGKSGLKVMQYMALGLPSVSSDFGNVKNFIIDGENGMLAKDEKEWYEKLIYLIDNFDIRKKIGNNARETIKKRFSMDKIKNQYLDILKND